jgi:hypothetical protein
MATKTNLTIESEAEDSQRRGQPYAISAKRCLLVSASVLAMALTGIAAAPQPAEAQFVCVGNASGAAVGDGVVGNTASGDGATASGIDSVACGTDATANGDTATAIGPEATAQEAEPPPSASSPAMVPPRPTRVTPLSAPIAVGTW